MSRWFRHYAGMMRDEKLVAVAIRSKQPVERVVWIWGAILESASEVDDAGRFEIDSAEIAYFLRADEGDICAVLDALASAGRVDSDRVVRWSDRQYQSDKSAERQARYRERKRSENARSDNRSSRGDVTITSRDGVVTLQETDTETDTLPDGSDDGEPPSEPDYRDQLWTQGTASIIRQTGHTERSAKSFIGKCLKAAGDDCRKVLTVIRQAEADRVVDPGAWISAALKAQPPPTNPMEEAIRQAAARRSMQAGQS